MDFCKTVVSEFFEYDTPKIVHIKNKKVGCMNRFIQLLILAYVIGYVIVYKKGYQEFCPVQSAVTTKLKGIQYTNVSDPRYNRIWDVPDYVVPPQENGAFFVMTNVIITPDQRLGICGESPNIKEAHCTIKDKDNCMEGKAFVDGNGIMTGNCDTDTSTCEVRAWCPVEDDSKLPLGKEKALLEDSKNFTVLIKNSIDFPLFNVKRRNILDSNNENYSLYLKHCQYDADSDPSCPIFKLGTIVHQAGENYSDLAILGGVIAIVIDWNCNLDFNVNSCIPTYSFRRLDNPDSLIAPGWNFRYAHYYNDTTRTLFKAYGIRFVIFVQGQAGKFSLIPLMLNIGSGLALLSIAVIVCDVIVLHCVKKRQFYYDKKYYQVQDAEVEESPNIDSSLSYHPF